ncbi:MAG TPA: VOC family protein [Polyangiaceae bacterium]|nr:VOC family protein [Polyangiaceae bacterium]
MRIHHLALRTRRLAKLAHFYRRVLGLSHLRTNRAAGRVRSVWLEAGRAILMLERADPKEPAIPRGSLELVAFAVSRAEHRRMLARLERLGVPLDGEPTAFTTYFRDPDGRRVAISHFAPVSPDPRRDAKRKKRTSLA